MRAVIGQANVGRAGTLGLFLLRALVPVRTGLGLVLILPSIALIAPSRAVVAEIGLNPLPGQLLQMVFRVVAGIGGHDGGRGAERGRGLNHRHEPCPFYARAVRLSLDAALVLLVHDSPPGVVLDDALGGGHLG